MPKIDYERGIPSLMSNLWLRHKLGLPQKGNNVYQVKLPATPDVSQRVQQKFNTIFDLIQHVKFEHILPFLNEEITTSKLIVYKDAFDYLLDILPKDDDIGHIKLKEDKNGDTQFDLTDIKFHTKWSAFIGSHIDYSSLGKEISPEMLVASLLTQINSGDDNIYRFKMMEPLRGKWMLSEKFVLLNRKRRTLFYRLFASSNKRSKDEMELNRMSVLIHLGLRCCLDEQQLVLIPNEILEMALKAGITNILKIQHIRSHANHQKAVEYMKHMLINYDNETYENRDILIILEYSYNEHLSIVEFLKKHYHTDKIVTIKSTIGDMRLSRMILQ